MAHFVYLSGDGDHIGREIGRASLADDPEKLRQLSNDIETGNELWRSWATANAGEVISMGGDGFRIRVPAEKLKDIVDLRIRYAELVGATITLGIGAKMSEADRALMAGKIEGGDRIRLYDPSVEEVLAEHKEPTEEEKIRDAYLKKSRSAAFRDSDGNIYETGNIHDIEQVPLEKQETVESGFVTNEGEFVNPLKKEEPALNTPAAGGGMTGPSLASPEAPQAPMGEASEHSENEALQSAIAGGPPGTGPVSPQQIRQAMIQMASDQGQKDTQAQQQEQADQEKAEGTDEIKNKVVSILKVFKDRSQELEGLQQQDPELYKSLVGMLQSMVELAKISGMVGQTPQGKDIQKSELTKALPRTHAENLENAKGFLNDPVAMDNVLENTNLKPVERNSPRWPDPLDASLPWQQMANRTANDTGTTSNEAWLRIHEANANNLRTHARQNAPDQVPLQPSEMGNSWKGPYIATWAPVSNSLKGIRMRAKAKTMLPLKDKEPVAKAALEAGKTGRHRVNYPVGTQIDPSPSGTREVGKIKIGDPVTGKTKWRSVRAGLVLSPDGTPTSSRNPSGSSGK